MDENINQTDQGQLYGDTARVGQPLDKADQRNAELKARYEKLPDSVKQEHAQKYGTEPVSQSIGKPDPLLGGLSESEHNDKVFYNNADQGVAEQQNQQSTGDPLGAQTVEEGRATEQLRHELGAAYEATINDAGRGAGKLFGSLDNMNAFLKANPEILRNQSFQVMAIKALAKYGRQK